jgi:hypothetical protein
MLKKINPPITPKKSGSGKKNSPKPLLRPLQIKKVPTKGNKQSGKNVNKSNKKPSPVKNNNINKPKGYLNPKKIPAKSLKVNSLNPN